MLRGWAQPLGVHWGSTFPKRPEMLAARFGTTSSFVLQSLLLWGQAKRSGVLWGISPLPLFTLHVSSFWSIATHCLGLTCLLYKPLSDPSSPILMARASPSRYTQTADTVTGPKSTLHQPGAFISRTEEPQHRQQWQPWPEKMFLEWYSWRLAASLTKLAVTAENLPGRFAQKKEMGCGRAWWWGEENILEHIPIFSHVFLTP